MGRTNCHRSCRTTKPWPNDITLEESIMNVRSPVARQTQNSLLMATAGNALTTVFAGFALTTTTLPNISLLPALVAGFFRVFSIAMPGMTNLAFFFTSSVAMAASASKNFFAAAGLISHASATAEARELFVITEEAIAFIFGAMPAARARAL